MEINKNEEVKVDELATTGKDVSPTKTLAEKEGRESYAKPIKPSQKQGNRIGNLSTVARRFGSDADMLNLADKMYDIYSSQQKKEIESDIKNGLDLSNAESVLNFEINYTPIGTNVILKKMYDKDKTESGLIIPEVYKQKDIGADKKYIVMVPGLQADVLERGDIVSMKATPDGSIRGFHRVFKGVVFIELDMQMIDGVHERLDIMKERQLQAYKKYKQAEREI